MMNCVGQLIAEKCMVNHVIHKLSKKQIMQYKFVAIYLAESTLLLNPLFHITNLVLITQEYNYNTQKNRYNLKH
jgi:hypothetical protein